jgi:hypothetical protein
MQTIADAEGIPVESQLLYHQGKRLQNATPLLECGIEPGVTLRMVCSSIVLSRTAFAHRCLASFCCPRYLLSCPCA